MAIDLDDLVKMAERHEDMKLAHDFGCLLNYITRRKVRLSPKEDVFPIRQLRFVMKEFKTKEEESFHIGEKEMSKERDTQFPRFFFIETLAISGNFVAVEKDNLLVKGGNWDIYFNEHVLARPVMLFWHYYFYFDFGIWFPYGNFGDHLNQKRLELWSYLRHWMDGKKVEWKRWASQVAKKLALKWEAPSQEHAEHSIIWGLEHCIVRPMSYFGILDIRKKPGRYGDEIDRFWLQKGTGRGYFEIVDETMRKRFSKESQKSSRKLQLLVNNSNFGDPTIH